MVDMNPEAAQWPSVKCEACGRSVKQDPETKALRPHRPGRTRKDGTVSGISRRELRAKECVAK